MIATAQARPKGFGFPHRDSVMITSSKTDDHDYDSDSDEYPSDRRSLSSSDYATDCYLHICKAEGVQPCPRFRRQLNTPVADLSNCLRSDREMKSICISLTANVSIKELDLSGNDLSGKGAIYLVDALAENVAINGLCLSQCNISLEGLKAISKVFLDFKSMKRLDLSQTIADDIECLCDAIHGTSPSATVFVSTVLPRCQNMFQCCAMPESYINHWNDDACDVNNRLRAIAYEHDDWIRVIEHPQFYTFFGNKFSSKHAEVLSNVIQKIDNIEDLYLNGNEFNETSGVMLGKALASNVGIKRLDLSWNHLRRKGAAAVCMALKHNCCIEDLDLSWNGLAQDGCKALQIALPHNHTLKELDITCNRISFVAIGDFLKGLEKNDTLTTIRINSNPITVDGAIGLMKVLRRSAVSEVKNVHMADIQVNAEFLDAMTDLEKAKKITVHHRDPNRKKITPEYREKTLSDYNPAMVLFEYMKQDNLLLIDLFRTVDVDMSKSVSKTEMKEGFMSINIPISEDGLEVLFEGLSMNDNDELEYE